jgi:hydrogenase nickel incorporation protein HypA/HybF
MHELGIITNIFTIIEEVATEHNLLKIHKVKLKIGKLQQIVPDIFTFAFETVAKGTKAEGAVLDVDYVPVKMKCQGCGCEFIVADNIYICPTCGRTQLTMLEGMEIFLESLEGEQKEEIEPC